MFDFDDFLSVFDGDSLLRALVHAHVLDIQNRVARLLEGVSRLLFSLILLIPSLFFPLLIIVIGLLVVLLHLLLGVVLFLANVGISVDTLDKLVILGRFCGRGILVGLALRVFSISHGVIVLEPAQILSEHGDFEHILRRIHNMVKLRILVSNSILAFILQLEIDGGIERILLGLSVVVEVGHLIHHILTQGLPGSVANEGVVEEFCRLLFRVALCLLHFENIFLRISPFSLSFALSRGGLQCCHRDGTHGPFLIVV